MTDGLLKGFFFTRLHLTRIHAERDPWISLTAMTRQEAIAFSTRFNIVKRGGLEYGEYYDQRSEVEDWLRQNARNAGVAIKKDHPIYFWLTAQSEAHSSTPERRIVSIPADEVDLSLCSFTFDDSFHNFFPGAVPLHPLHGKVLSATEADAAVREHGFLVDTRSKTTRYIEAQVWASREEFILNARSRGG